MFKYNANKLTPIFCKSTLMTFDGGFDEVMFWLDSASLQLIVSTSIAARVASTISSPPTATPHTVVGVIGAVVVVVVLALVAGLVVAVAKLKGYRLRTPFSRRPAAHATPLPGRHAYVNDVFVDDRAASAASQLAAADTRPPAASQLAAADTRAPADTNARAAAGDRSSVVTSCAGSSVVTSCAGSSAYDYIRDEDVLPLAVFRSNVRRQAADGGGQLEAPLSNRDSSGYLLPLSNRDSSGYLLPLPSCEASTAVSRERPPSAVGETVSMRAAGRASSGAAEQVDASVV